MPVVTTAVGNETGATVYNLTASQTLLVSQQGYLYQGGAGSAVDITGNDVTISNSGVIVSTVFAIKVSASSSDIVNHGTIEGQITYQNLTGINRVINHGNISFAGGYTLAGSSAVAATEVLINYGTVGDSGSGSVAEFERIENFGLIRGDILSSETSSLALTLANKGGTIGGNILSGAGADSINLIGGTIFGTVDSRAGDDVFLIDSSNATGLERLNAGGGTDTLDVSQAAGAFWIDLMFYGVQAWTSGTGVATGANANTQIATLAGFENVIGTKGADTFFGSNGNNLFVWNGGYDLLTGRGGSDTVDVSFAPSIWVDLNYLATEIWTSGTTWSSSGNATIMVANTDGFENIIGTAGSDQISGDARDNRFASGGVSFTSGVLDRFNGGEGSDTFDLSGVTSGGLWVDLMFGGVQVWTSRTSVASGSNATTPFANLSSVENIVGSFSTDEIHGNNANNTYFYTAHFSAQWEIVDLRGGNDTFDATESIWSLYVSLEFNGTDAWTSFTDTSTSSNATTRAADFSSVENITGSRFNDTLIGDGGANRIAGSRGDDDLTGRGGADTFVIRPAGGTETIRDFFAEDVIELSGFASFTTFAQVFASAFQNGADTFIPLGNDPDYGLNTSIILKGVLKTGLVADDFLFV